nr:glutamic acid-rich protein-like [Aegilops tauschii subsp. strangulata]
MEGKNTAQVIEAMTNPHEEAKMQQNTDEDPAEEHAIQQAPVKAQSNKSGQKDRKRRKTSGKELAAPTVDEEQQETNEEKCQIKAGAAFAHVKKAWNLLKDRHKQDIWMTGFGSIDNSKITGSICRPLAAHIYDNLDTKSMTITFGDGTEDKKIKITKEAIHKVFGYPNGTEKSAPRPEKSPTSMKELMSDLGFKHTNFKPKELFRELKILVELDDEQSNRKSERTNSPPGQDELQQQDGVNNPKNTNERNKQSDLTTDNATTTTTPTQAQDTINVRTCEEITITSTKEKEQDIPADEKQETVIPDKETVEAGTNNPVINTEETNEYADIEDQELQTTTCEEREETNEQKEDTEEGQHVLQKAVINKHEEGDHGDTSNEADTHIVPEKEAETIEENPTPSYDANSPGREVSANQVETEKQDGKYHQQDTTVDKEKHDAKKNTNDSNEDAAKTEQKGTMEKGDKDSDSVNKAIEDLYNVICKPWTQREMDELFITTNKFDVNLGHVAESFKVMDVSRHAVAQESCTDDEEKDPPIEPDQPPPDDKTPHHAEEQTDEQNINSNTPSTEQLEQTGTDLKEDGTSNYVPNTQEHVSEQKKQHVLLQEETGSTSNQQGTSSTISLEFLKPKTMEKHDEVDEFRSSLTPLQLEEYNEHVKMGVGFDVIKTWLNDHESYEFNKDPTPYLTILQQESGEHSMPQSSENSSDKKISVKKRLEISNIWTKPEHFMNTYSAKKDMTNAEI